MTDDQRPLHERFPPNMDYLAEIARSRDLVDAAVASCRETATISSETRDAIDYLRERDWGNFAAWDALERALELADQPERVAAVEAALVGIRTPAKGRRRRFK